MDQTVKESDIQRASVHGGGPEETLHAFHEFDEVLKLRRLLAVAPDYKTNFRSCNLQFIAARR